MFTLVHVVISVLGLITGFVAVGGFMAGARRDGVTGAATGFGFASEKLLPSHIVAVISLVVLVVQLFAKTPALAALAPTQSEAPFAVTQLLVLVLFVWLGRASLRGSSAAR